MKFPRTNRKIEVISHGDHVDIIYTTGQGCRTCWGTYILQGSRIGMQDRRTFLQDLAQLFTHVNS